MGSASINKLIAETQRIPQGRYWVDVFEKNETAWTTWIEWCGKADLASAEVTETAEDGHTFVIFNVEKESGAPWPNDTNLPPVNLAGPEIHTSADTVQRPDPPKPIIDEITDGASKLVGGVVVGGLVLGGLLVYLSTRRG